MHNSALALADCHRGGTLTARKSSLPPSLALFVTTLPPCSPFGTPRSFATTFQLAHGRRRGENIGENARYVYPRINYERRRKAQSVQDRRRQKPFVFLPSPPLSLHTLGGASTSNIRWRTYITCFALRSGAPAGPSGLRLRIASRYQLAPSGNGGWMQIRLKFRSLTTDARSCSCRRRRPTLRPC